MDSADKLQGRQSVNSLAQTMRTPFKLHPSQVLRVNTRSPHQPPPLLTSHTATLQNSYSRIASAMAPETTSKAIELTKSMQSMMKHSS